MGSIPEIPNADPVTPKMPAKPKSGEKQTPSLSMPIEGETEEEEVSVESYGRDDIKKEALFKVWDAYFDQKKDSLAGVEAMVLRNKPVLRENCVLELVINNGVEINILKKMEEELLGYLRRELNNGDISITHVQAEQEEGENLYTDQDKFDDMAKRNPTLNELKDRLGLDTDY